MSEGETPKVQEVITVSPVSGGYRLPGFVGGVPVTVLLDTGAAVTLLRQDVWTRALPQRPTLKPWSGATLVSAGGTPLTIHGHACIDFELGGRKFHTDFVVVSPLTSEAILGIDFLQEQLAMIDLGQKQLRLRKSGCHIALNAPTPVQSCSAIQSVRMMSTVELLPRAVTEVPAYCETAADGVWLVEETVGKNEHIAVARAIVKPTSASIPVSVVNISDEPVTLYAGMVVASMQPIEPPAEVGSISNVEAEGVDEEKQQMLWQLVEECGSELSSGERDVFYHLLLTYADVFASSTSDLGRTDKLHHSINTGNSPPVRQPVRRIPPSRREEVKGLLNQMLEREIIEPSSSPWASPVVLVQKKDGSTRFCIDYRKLNQVTRKDAYPLPRIDMTLDTLHGSKWFTTLDLLSGYWQVEMKAADKEKTAFCTTEGLFQFKVMPFGLCNAPASFQRLMDLVLTGLQWSQCLVYLDDIVVLGRSFEEHIQNLNAVFQRLHQSGLRLKPSKCSFFKEQVQYLGHIISRDGVATDPEKTAKVATWPVPTCKRETQQFLGFANYYRRFIKDFAQLARPLHRLTEKTAPFTWNGECQTSFDQLRKCLCSAPVLAYPDFSRAFILDTDASDTGIGGVLSQLDENGRERVIAYGSKLLTKSERQYCVTRRELLAVVTYVRQYRPYLISQKFTLRTDHGSLTWLRNFREPEGQLARWLERLQELDFEVVHRRGTAHKNADALSRLPCRQCGRDTHATAEVAVTTLHPSDSQTGDLRQMQLADAVLAPLLQGKEADTKPDIKSFPAVSKAARRLLQIWDQLIVHSGVLCRQFQPTDNAPGGLQTVIPEALRTEVLADFHEGPMGGHLGVDKTFSRLRERFYWPGYHRDVQDWCRNCGTCASRKTPAPKARAPLKPIVTSYPLQLVAMDIMGPLPESTAGNSYILVVADYFTRYTEAYPIPNQEAITVATKLVDEFFFRFSPPEQLHSDQGRNFESSIITEVCKLLGIEKSRTTPYHPQSDGLVERFNRTLLDMLATAVTDHPFEWEQHLRRLCLAYNTSIHPTTGHSPFSLMFGRQARMPVDIMLGTTVPSSSTIPRYVATLRSSLETAYAHVREHMGHQLEQQKKQYDLKTSGCPFKCGDLVWLHSTVVPRGKSKKLHRPWTGPYRVVKKLSDIVYRLQHTQLRRKRPVVHRNRLKPCPAGTRLPWTPNKQPQVAQPSQRPQVGDSLELIDDDSEDPCSCPASGSVDGPAPGSLANDGALRSPEPAIADETLHPPSSDTATPTPRYPRRQRSAPNRLYPTVSH